MSSFRLSSVFLAAVAAFVPALLVGACGGNVVVEDGVCAAGLQSCGGECVNLSSDADHCGACDNACFDGSCVEGVCPGTGCGGGLTLCDGVCVSTESSTDHCGACGVVCPDGVCVQGMCKDLAGCGCGLWCNVTTFGGALPATLVLSTSTAIEQWWPVCSDTNGPDLVFQITPPFSGNFLIDTAGSSVAAAVDLTDVSCSSQGCAFDFDGTGAYLQTFLTAGKTVFIVVDTQGQKGEVALTITPLDSPECIGCGPFIQGEIGELCPESELIYDKTVECICFGACSTQCEGLCNGSDVGPECEACIFDTVDGCGQPVEECLNDF
ncbi:MAG: hypothetical protein R3B70_02745 [Polyangiaceae bacterium]